MKYCIIVNVFMFTLNYLERSVFIVSTSYGQCQAEESRKDVALMSKRLRAVIIGLFSLLALACIVTLAQLSAENTLSPRLEALPPLRILCKCAEAGMGVAIVLIAVRMLADAAAYGSPFSRAQAKRLFVIGLLFTACAVFGIFESIELAFASGDSLLHVEETRQQFNNINVDILLIVAAIVSFYLSYLFKFGSFLQWLYEGTV